MPIFTRDPAARANKRRSIQSLRFAKSVEMRVNATALRDTFT